MIYLDWAGASIFLHKNIKVPEFCFSSSRSNLLVDDFMLDFFELLKKKFNAKNYKIYFGSNVSDLFNKLALLLKNNDFSVISSPFEHHSAFVPWKNLFKNFSFALYKENCLIFKKADIILIQFISNITGTLFEDIIIKLRKQFPDSFIIVDGAQSAGYNVDLIKLQVDFFCFSSQKYGGIAGLGICFVSERLDKLLEIAFLGGGNIREAISEIFIDKNSNKFGVGTPNLLAMFYLKYALLNYNWKVDSEIWIRASNLFDKYESIQLPFKQAKPYFSFNLKNIHSHDVSDFLYENDIICRSGNLCCSKFLFEFNLKSVVRISLGPSTKMEDIFLLEKLLVKLQKDFFK